MQPSDYETLKVSDMLQAGIKYQRTGRFPEARKIYNTVLNAYPNQTDALHLLGVIAYQTGDQNTAIRLIENAIVRKPETAEFYNSLGAAQQAMGNIFEAVHSYIKAISLRDDYKEAYQNLLTIRPDSAEVHFNFGCILHRKGDLSDAIQHYKKAVTLQPDHAEAFNNLGCAFRESDLLDDAIFYLKQAVKVKPDYAGAYHNLGYVYQQKKLYSKALKAYKTAISIKPDYTEAHLDLGRALQNMGKPEEAIPHYQEIIRLKTDQPKAYYNWAYALHELGRDNDAINKYTETILRFPDHIESHVNRAFLLLMNRRYIEAWPEYDWRIQRPDWRAVNSYYPGIPRWDGSYMEGKRILVQAEQGLGDTIQFSRYLPFVKARCGKLILEAQQSLHPLLKTIPGVDEVVPRTPENAGIADAAIHIMSLAGIFNTTVDTIPSSAAYLAAQADRIEKWRKIIPQNGFKIGIAWSGNPANNENINRSCNLAHFAPLSAIPGVRFFSLQKGTAAGQLQNIPKEMRIQNLGPLLEDFADTAAAIALLDLIVSVDTALVHLTGALGRPIWTLRYHSPYWVWGKTGDTSPWYDSMRVFRQQQPGDWDGLFRNVTNILKGVVANQNT